MSENKKLELLDQYDDVTFALLMDEYAEEEGARLRKEFEEAQAAGEISDTSDALDEKCLQLIHRDFAKKRGKDNIRKIIRMTSKVAVAVMVFIGVAATTIMSVDALRIPVLNFIIEQYEQYSSLQLGDNEQNNVVISTTDYVWGLLPEDYYVVSSTDTEMMKISMYENGTGDTVQFIMTQTAGTYNIDTEDALCSEIVIGDYKALLLEEDGYQIIWYDEVDGVVYNFRATGLTKDAVFDICINLANHYG